MEDDQFFQMQLNQKYEEKMKQRSLEQQVQRRRSGAANKAVIEGLEKLFTKSMSLARELSVHEGLLTVHLFELGKVAAALEEHEKTRQGLFVPVRANSISRSVLYQKSADLSLFAPRPEIDDADPTSERGRISASGLDVTGHEAIELAAAHEDAARTVCNSAMKALREARSQRMTRQSAVEEAVRTSREAVTRQKRAARVGHFGSTGVRDTNPASRRMATNPEDR